MDKVKKYNEKERFIIYINTIDTLILVSLTILLGNMTAYVL